MGKNGVGRVQPGMIHAQKDRPILKFLWDWKIASTQVIALKFGVHMKYPGHGTYRRLAKLERLGFIQRVADDKTYSWVWSLKKRGFEAIRHSLPSLREEGFISECVRHDRLVQVAHLGPHLLHDCENVNRFTEQQLRRFNIESFPAWVPNNTKHRPDGYWRIPTATGPSVVGLEVEVSRKMASEYAKIGAFYNRTRSVSRVLWIAPSISICQAILKSLNSGEENHRRVHSFFLLRDLQRHGWEMRCVVGENVEEKYADFLQPAQWEMSGKPAGNGWEKFPAKPFLESRISAVNLDV